MSARRLSTSSKRKRTTPQKLKSRKLFAVSGNDLSESGDGENQDGQLCLSPSPETLHNWENVPKSLHQSPSKKESLTETPRNKENMPGKYASDSEMTQRGRGRPKGSKNKTFPVTPTRVYSVREGKSPAYSPKKDSDIEHENGVTTPGRGRGRPKGSRKVIPSGEDTPKRSRGRPKGSKNKKPPKTTMMKGSSGVQKAGRGRPRKLPLTSEGETPKRERGRPKGSLNKVPSAKKLAILSGTQEKRNRGRPKKIVLHQSPVLPLGPKRPRGRPKSITKELPVPDEESGDEENQDGQLCLSPSPETLHDRENVPNSLHQSPSKKESLTETPQNKENMPGKYASDSEMTQRGQGRPKGSKSETFLVSPTMVYSVREGESPACSPKKDSDIEHENGATTPGRGRGRPKGSRKVYSVHEGESPACSPKKDSDIEHENGVTTPGRGRPKGSRKKAGRGRPRKLPLTSEGETPKRERGRPKGSLSKVPSATKLAILSGTQEKRNRGRPKKIVLHQSPVVPLSPKRPRGRPKSITTELPVPDEELNPSEDYSQEEEDCDKNDEEDDESDE